MLKVAEGLVCVMHQDLLVNPGKEGMNMSITTNTEEKTFEERLMEAKSNIELSRLGQELAARYLLAHDYEVIERSWSCDYGEADIIAKDEDGMLCFIDVETRKGQDAGLPEEAATEKKKKMFEQIALNYMFNNKLDDMTQVRFDSIAICVMDGVSRALLRHNKAAFHRGLSR